MKAVDIFCGAGGLTRGLLDAGIDVVAGLDRDECCRVTYEHNNPGVRFIQADIREIGLKDLCVKCRLRRFDDVLFAGCAPCQPFSSQRKGNGERHDATLLCEFGRLVEAAQPGYVLIENVPGIAKVHGFSTFRRFLAMLDANGYRYVYDVLDAKHYGVPQNRRRLVLLAAREQEPSLPQPGYGSRRPVRTVRQAIYHFPPIAAGECHARVPNHVAASITELNLERLGLTPHNGGDRRSWPKRLRLECHKGNYKGHTDVYGRMSWDSPSPALTGRCHSISNGRYGHPEQDRAISLREAAAIQTFPDGYVFFGTNKHIAKQIGNAVPVRLAEQIGKHVLNICGNGRQSSTTTRGRTGARKGKR
jgi:DNA (cytosine-5)-methyltransferase 1